MTVSTLPDLEALHQRARTAIAAHSKFFLLQGVILVLLGMLAVALPVISTLGIDLVVGTLLIVGGCLRTALTLPKRHLPGFWWSLLNGVLAIALGILLVARPLQGILTLTLLMAAFFLIEGVLAVLIALEFRRYLRHWGFMLFSGLVNLLLAYLIWRGWPSIAGSIIGLYVGINMIFLGVPLIMTAFAAKQGAAPAS